ncbi:MAG: hypothetical protein LBD68_06250 [Zoogloeaceae bacterium]|jgi:hypothetical protein|nr:hypothetical protein [Zoogloeaceae bacterium]
MNIILEDSEKPAASRRQPTYREKANDYTFEKQRARLLLEQAKNGFQASSL